MRNSIDVNLDIEKIIYVVFIIISVMGIIGTNYEEKFIVYEWSCCHASQLMRPGHH